MSLPIVLLGVLVATGRLSGQASALPDSPDVPMLVAIDPRNAICYMETADGRVIDLSRVCGAQENQPNALSATDQRFLNDYQAVLRNRFGRLPSAQAALSQAQQNPQAVIQRAQSTCASIQDGMVPELASPTPGSVDADVVNQLALNYYCPELDD